MVSLFAGVLHDSHVRLKGPGFSNGPGFRIRFGIVYGVSVLRVTIIHALECLSDVRLITERVANRIDSNPPVEVVRLDDQRVSIPVTDGFAKPGRGQILVELSAVGRDNVEP